MQSGANEQAAAMAYLELLLRCVTRWGLLKTVLHFLFVYEYDGVRVIDVLLRRLEGNSQVSTKFSIIYTYIYIHTQACVLKEVNRDELHSIIYSTIETKQIKSLMGKSEV